MGKVKLTREQAEAVAHKQNHDGRYIGAILEDLFYKKHPDTNVRSVNGIIREMGLETFIKAKYIGYEVEETFEVGDWVYVGWRDGARIQRILNTGVTTSFGTPAVEVDDKKPGYSDIAPVSIIRYATPEEIAKEKQRRWWAENGREVWELKQKDILVKGNCESIVDHVGKDKVVLIKNGLKVVVKMFNIKKHYRVRYLAEDRKDVDHAE